MIRAVLATLAFAGAAYAETPLVSIVARDAAMLAFAGDVVKAEPSLDLSNQPALNIRLDPRFDKQMAELTSAHIGDVVAILICGELKSEPVILTEILTANVVVSGLTEDEAKRMATMLANGSCDPALAN